MNKETDEDKRREEQRKKSRVTLKKLLLIVPVMLASSLNLEKIVENQTPLWNVLKPVGLITPVVSFTLRARHGCGIA